MKIAFIADLHYCGNDNVFKFLIWDHEKVAREIHDSKPDVLVVGGDIAESYADPSLLSECLNIYNNPHGASLFIPGNHDVWCLNTSVDAERKYEWNLETARKHGWVPLKDEPWSLDDVWFAGNMGWYDLRSCPKWLGFGPEYYEKVRNWSDYRQMCKIDPSEKTPMLDFCRKRMAELERSFELVPKERRALVVVTHIVGFDSLLGIFDENTAYFGNKSIGKKAIKAKATHYLCGHSHDSKNLTISAIKCINNGSDYGCKKINILEI
jgi:Icc-related predicted phosphoesterase